MYDIIYKKLWYHIWYHSFSLSCANDNIMISYQKLWYCVWYHILCCDIMYQWYHKNNYKSLSCAIFMADIIYILYVFAYDISNLWFRVWFRVWFCPMISVTWYIIAIWYHGFSDIASYIMTPARQPGTPSLSLTPK